MFTCVHVCVCVYFCGSGLLRHKLKKYFYPKKASWSPAEPRRVERAVCNEKGALEVERVHARAESVRRESEGSCSRRLGMNQQRAYLTPSTTSTCHFRPSVHPPPADFTLDDFILARPLSLLQSQPMPVYLLDLGLLSVLQTFDRCFGGKE